MLRFRCEFYGYDEISGFIMGILSLRRECWKSYKYYAIQDEILSYISKSWVLYGIRGVFKKYWDSDKDFGCNILISIKKYFNFSWGWIHAVMFLVQFQFAVIYAAGIRWKSWFFESGRKLGYMKYVKKELCNISRVLTGIPIEKNWGSLEFWWEFWIHHT